MNTGYLLVHVHIFITLLSQWLTVYLNGSFIYWDCVCIIHLAEWEAELQKELTDYEVVGEASAEDDAALEKEIMEEMSKSGEDLKWEY